MTETVATQSEVMSGQEDSPADTVNTRDWIAPAVDIMESADKLQVTVNMPGVLPDDIDVTFEKGVLRIAGRVSRPTGEGEYHIREFAPTGYERKFEVSERIGADGIAADYSEGLLTLTLPKIETAKARTIPVTTK